MTRGRRVGWNIIIFGVVQVCLLHNVSDHWQGFWQGTALALCQQWRPKNRARDSETGLGAHSLEDLGLAYTSPSQPIPARPSPPQPPPPPCGLPAPSPAVLFWLQLLGVYVCTQPTPTVLLPPMHFWLFPPMISYVLLFFSFMNCPLTEPLTHPLSFFLSLLCPSSHPPFARHGGCNSAQQLLSWHVLHCLLTVLFLLDFIKTPSAVSSGMVEEVVEAMEAEGYRRKAKDLAAEGKANGWTQVESENAHETVEMKIGFW